MLWVEYKSEKVYDLGARDVILPPFDSYSNGKYMPAAHMFANGGGILRALTPINDSVEIISEEIGFDKRRHSPALRGLLTPSVARTENGRISPMSKQKRAPKFWHPLIPARQYI